MSVIATSQVTIGGIDKRPPNLLQVKFRLRADHERWVPELPLSSGSGNEVHQHAHINPAYPQFESEQVDIRGLPFVLRALGYVPQNVGYYFDAQDAVEHRSRNSHLIIMSYGFHSVAVDTPQLLERCEMLWRLIWGKVKFVAYVDKEVVPHGLACLSFSRPTSDMLQTRATLHEHARTLFVAHPVQPERSEFGRQDSLVRGKRWYK